MTEKKTRYFRKCYPLYIFEYLDIEIHFNDTRKKFQIFNDSGHCVAASVDGMVFDSPSAFINPIVQAVYQYISNNELGDNAKDITPCDIEEIWCVSNKIATDYKTFTTEE